MEQEMNSLEGLRPGDPIMVPVEKLRENEEG
jgi:hypothetical protein